MTSGFLNVLAEILRMQLIWFVVWVASGIWVDVLLLQKRFSPKIRVLVIPVCGLATHMILITNLSYLGVPVRQGWWIALLLSLILCLPGWRQVRELLQLKRFVFGPAIIILLAILVQCFPLMKVNVITTIPAENGDWPTYVPQADILADYGYKWKSEGGAYLEFQQPAGNEFATLWT